MAALQTLPISFSHSTGLLTQIMGLLHKNGASIATQPARDNEEISAINNRVQLAEAAAIARRRINCSHLLAGVTMLDPSSVWIGPDVILSKDVEVLPMTIIYGKCLVGTGSVIGPNTRLNNVRIGAGCVIDESIVIDSLIEDRVSCGPRAYLRPGTVMRSGSKAGTHVEIKNSDIGRDSKVPHLSYIGDATLGAEVNIGAGSITCNFDGAHKNHTQIGDRSFIGSDTMFVAPIEVGCDVTVGAGSVITKDVPDGVLAVARSRQVIIEDWNAHEQARSS